MSHRYYKGEHVYHVVGRYVADSRNIEYATKDRAWTTDVRQAQCYHLESVASKRAYKESSADSIYTITVLPVTVSTETSPVPVPLEQLAQQVSRVPVLYCVWRER